MNTNKWALDPTHSDLGFKIRHLMITNVSGSFKNFNVEVQTTGDDFTTAQVEMTADISSISTRNEQRDAHLRTSDFFEAEKYPQLQFRSTSIEKIDDENFNLHGNLTMKGITKPVTLKVTYSTMAKDPWGNQRAGFEITGKINRYDWNITFNNVLETGGVGLSEEVKINSEIELVKVATAVAA